MPRLTDISEITGTLSGDFLIHIVDPNDTTDSPEGTSYRTTLDQLNSVIISGTTSAATLYEVGTGSNSTQRIGVTNSAGGDFSATLGGSGNTTSASAQYATIVGGRDNSLTGEYNFIGGGQDNSNFTIGWSSIVGGLRNTQQGKYSFIGGGEDNTIFSGPGTFSEWSSIVGGRDNRVEGKNIHIIGSGITGSTDDTTYVNHLNIGTLATGTSVNNLGIDASGNVVVGASGGGAPGNGASKPQLFIYPGSTPSNKTLNGYGIGKLNTGVGNPGSIGTPTLTLEIPKILNFGDSIVWKTRVREAGFDGMRLKLWNTYLIGTSVAYVAPFQSGAYGTPIIVDLEINIIKFEGASSSKRYRIEVNQINYYVTETPITTAEENNRYHIANDSIDQIGLPLFVNTYPLFIGLSDTDPFITQDDLTWEFTKTVGGAFGLDYSYSKLITA